jgi:hypothetical protein
MSEASTPREVRAVTHYDVTRQHCARAAEGRRGVTQANFGTTNGFRYSRVNIAFASASPLHV